MPFVYAIDDRVYHRNSKGAGTVQLKCKLLTGWQGGVLGGIRSAELRKPERLLMKEMLSTKDTNSTKEYRIY